MAIFGTDVGGAHGGGAARARVASIILSIAFAALLAACRAPPAPPPAQEAPAAPSASERKAAVLRQYGFEPTDSGWELQMSGKLLFDFDSVELNAEGRDGVLRMGRALADVGIDALRVEGHADEQGARAYNERLSLRRAQAVARVLAEAGLPADHIGTVGLGASRPVVQGTSAASRRENRRVAIIVPAF
ncbi:OmpA family protein [Paracidovorax avenae]|uniref:OmpA family protein n=1 Tax=Paracidovorax avenae TaxID=80867 RepID=UPI00186473C9|nr:OmpA family protein [Paracidovorax avenae]